MKTQIKLLTLLLLQCLIVTTLVAQELVAHYPFNGNAHDETGNGYNGTIFGATLSDDRMGNPTSAYSFDGSNDKIVIGKEPNFPSWNTYAVSLWFLSDGGGDQGQGYGQKILSRAQYYTDFHLSVGNNDANGNLIWWSAQGGFNSVTANHQDYRDNQWHHVVLNKNSPGEGDIWVDGVLQASFNGLQAVFNNEDLVIGFTTHSDGYQQKYFSGKIDDIRIYNDVLSTSEIAELFLECNGVTTVYADGDGDGHGDPANDLLVEDCVVPGGYVHNSTDCNDANAAIHPGATEEANGIDDNCNGIIDDIIQTLLVAYYPFNGNAHDETGHGYNGTVFGATLTDDRIGNPMSAYSFDGVNDKIVIGKEPNFPSWNTYAVSLWFLSDGGGSQGQGYGQKILSKAQFYTDFHLSVGNNDMNGQLNWWSAQGGFNAVADDDHDYRDNQWHHAVLNKKSPSEGDLWIDGVLQASSNTLQAVFNNEDLVIGFTTHSDGYQQKYFSGKIDDIRIYDGTLSPDEILELFMEAGSGIACLIPSNLTVTNITSSSAKLNWDDVPTALGYKIQYKVAGTSEWTKTTASKSNSKPIYGLSSGTSYEYRVKSVCSTDPKLTSGWSSSQKFTTLDPGGEDQYFTVPEGVTQLTVKLWGAGGAGGNFMCDDLGGGGGFVTGTIDVTPGETLTIVVGAKGETGAGPGAYGGGGGKENGMGGRGGGRSAILRDGLDIVTAGGGGGGGGSSCDNDASGGGGGGVEGQASFYVPYSGEPGTHDGPGDGGHRKPDDFYPNCTCGSNPGIGHDGGYASQFDNGYHGSGGGGYYGGGSGTDFGDGGGGGGSGLVPAGGYSEQGNTVGITVAGGTSDADYPGNNIGYGGGKGENGNNGAVVIVGYWPVLKLSQNTVTGAVQIYPNPAENYTTIHFTLQQSSPMSIVLCDLNGNTIQTLVEGELQMGHHSIPLNTDHFSKGIYVVRMIHDHGMEHVKLVVQ